MYRFILGVLVALVLSSNVGCLIPIYDADPAYRTRQMIYHAEDLRQLREEWHRFWMTDQPSHLTPSRVHGGVI